MRTSGELVLRVCMLLLGQDVLREKEHHIEQLIKERELERSELTRAAAGHAQQIEGKLQLLRQEYEQYRSECETKFHEHLSLLAQMEKQRGTLSSQLDDEKKKFEDIQFRFEEESILKSDFEAASKHQLSHLKDLEENLNFERQKNEKLEKELDDMKLQHLERDKRSIDNQSELSDLKAKLKKVSAALAERDRELSEKADITTSCKEKDNIIERLRNDINTANNLLKEKHIGNEVQLVKDLQRAEMQLSSKTFDNEHNLEKIKEMGKEITDLQYQLEASRKALKSNCKLVETEDEQKLKKTAENLRASVKQATEEIFNTKKECATKVSEVEMKLRSTDIELKYERAENDRLKAEVNRTIVELTDHSESGKRRHTRQIEQRELYIAEMSSSLELKTEELNTCQLLTTQLETEICTKNDMIVKLQAEMTANSKGYKEHQLYIEKLIAELKASQMSLGEWERKYHASEQTIAQLQQIKAQLEMQIKSIMEGSADSGRQLTMLNEEIRRLQHAMETLKIEMNTKIEQAVRSEQEMRFTLQKTTEQFQMERNRLQELLKAAKDAENTIRGQCDKQIEEAYRLHEQLRIQISQLSKVIETNKLEYSKLQEESNEIIRELKAQISSVNGQQQNTIQNYLFKIEQLTQEVNNLNLIIKQKSELLIAAEEKLNKHLMESKLLSNQDKMAFEQKISSLMSEIATYQKTIETTRLQLEKTSQELNEIKTTKFQFEQILHEQKERITYLESANVKCEQAYTETKTFLVQTQQQIQELNVQINTLVSEKSKVELSLQQSSVKISTLTNQMNNLQVEISNVRHVIQEKDQNIATITAEMHQYKREKESMDSVLIERENKIVALMTQIETVQKERGTHTEIFKAQERQIIDLKTQLQRVSQEKMEINSFIVQKENHILELTRQLEQKTIEVNNFVRQKETEITIMKEQLQVVQQEKSEIQHSVQEKDQKLIILTNNIQALQTEKLVLESAVKDHEQNFLAVKEELRQTGNCQIGTQAIVQELESKIQEKEHTINYLKLDVQKLREEWAQPTNNPIVNEIVVQLEQKEKEVHEKETQLIVLNNEIKQAREQTQQIQASWQTSVQEWKEKVVQLEEAKQVASQQCNNLQQQIIVLGNQAQNAQKIEVELQNERTKYAEIYAQLTAAEEHKINLVKKLETVVQSTHQQEQCSPVVNIIKEIQKQPTIQMEQYEHHAQTDVIALHKQLEQTKMQLFDRQNELSVQRAECANLQKQLLQVETKVVEVPVPVPGPVQFIERCTQTSESQVKPIVVHENKQANTAWNNLHIQPNTYQNLNVLHYAEKPTPAPKEIIKIVEKPVYIKEYVHANANANANAVTNVQVKKPEQKLTQVFIPQVPHYYQTPQPVYPQFPVQQVQQQSRGTEAMQHYQELVVRPEFTQQVIQPVAPQPRPIIYYINQQNEQKTQQQQQQQQEKFVIQMQPKTQQTQKIFSTQVPIIKQITQPVVANAAASVAAEAAASASAATGGYSYIPFVPNQVNVEAMAQANAQANAQVSGGVVCDTSNIQQVMYEKSMMAGQVEFLNSIIVDMQRKNEELRAKIEVLESGCYTNTGFAAASAGANIAYMPPRVIPPRQYCDICEIFDAHETEECPIQVTDADVDHVIRAIQPAARPYCEICEAFGHETAECNANDTY